jgi:RNA recognition motif-containing protein
VGKKLYVGNLSYSVSNADLEAMFAPFGTVRSAQVIEDRDTGRSKGFAFVEMGTDQEAEAAIAGLSGKEHDGRALTVKARPSCSLPLRPAMAASASWSVPISTNAKPLLRPVSRSSITCALRTVPNGANIVSRSALLTV